MQRLERLHAAIPRRSHLNRTLGLKENPLHKEYGFGIVVIVSKILHETKILLRTFFQVATVHFKIARLTQIRD